MATSSRRPAASEAANKPEQSRIRDRLQNHTLQDVIEEL
jgi:hypothetical protein